MFHIRWTAAGSQAHRLAYHSTLGLSVTKKKKKVQGSGFGVQGSGFWVLGSGFRFQGSGFQSLKTWKLEEADVVPRGVARVVDVPAPHIMGF